MTKASPLAAAAIEALRRHAPFDDMAPAPLADLAGRLQVAYHPRGERIVGPEDGTVERLRIVKQGRVESSGGEPQVVLGPGEMFPIGALVGRRATVYRYAAAEDTFCWELAADDFHRLLQESPPFHAFCTDHLASLVERSHRAQKAEAERGLLDAAGMLAPLRQASARKPVSCGPGTPVGEVLATMHRLGIGSMVVVDGEERPLGIFTQPDVLARVALPQAPPDTPMSRLMTPSPVALEEDATLADAALAMARHGIRHVVVTRDGRLAGVVSERDLFALQRVSLSRTSQRLRSAASVEELVPLAEEIRRLGRHLLAQGVGAEQLTSMVSALNDALAQRLIALAAARHALPARWCWLALGSEGRMEQTFVTDQDNALLYADEPGAQAALLAFADEVNRGLDACGFPLCKGDIMARNPQWCLDAQAWRGRFDAWIRAPQPEALLNASIFFDFRPLAGDAALAGDLRESVLEQTRANAAFQRALASSAVQTRPPLGLLGGFGRDFQSDELDLKAQGARLFVDAARILALAAGRAETSTAARLRAAGETAAVEAFHFIQSLRLRRQGNLLPVAELNDHDRRVLKESFRQAVELQERLRLDYRL